MCLRAFCSLPRGKKNLKAANSETEPKTTTVTVVKAWWRAANSEVNESMCDDQTPNQTPVW